jgi:hypothetical protein
LTAALASTIRDHEMSLIGFLKFAPQTNEVARAAIIYPGLLEVARIVGRPLALFELGASAGLNLRNSTLLDFTRVNDSSKLVAL